MVTETLAPVVPNQEAIDANYPTIQLGKVLWPIPLMAIKQNRVIVTRLLKLLPSFGGITPDTNLKDPEVQKQLIRVISGLDETAFADLELVVFTALTRAHPKLTKAQFDDMEAAATDLFAALPIIIKQCGMFRPALPGEAELMGEAKAELPQTGTR